MKNVMNIIKNIIVWGITLLAIGMMIFTIISVNTFNRNDRDLFGYKAYIVLSDSMATSDINAGDLVLIQETDPSTLQEGDIIAYISQNTENYGEVVTHKIRSLVTDANGNPGFITYGTTTNTDDETVVTHAFVLGKHAGTLPKVGTFFQFLKTPQGYFVCIFIPFMLLIVYQGLNCVQLFRRYRQEQMEEMETEKAKISEERAETAKMLAELQALKAQLEHHQQKAEPVVEQAAEYDEILDEAFEDIE